MSDPNKIELVPEARTTPEVTPHEAVPAVSPEKQPLRPLSPVVCINAGALDDKPVTPAASPLEALLVANMKILKSITTSKPGDMKKVHSYVENFTVEDIRKAVDDVSTRAAGVAAALPDVTLQKVPAPIIADEAISTIEPKVSKDFSWRTNNGFFASISHHTVSMKDLLTAAAEVAETHKLSPKAILALIRRSLRDPARTFLENLVDSNISLKGLWEELQACYSQRMPAGEASRRLGQLLSKPIDNLDNFLSDILNLSILSQRSLPASMQNKGGHLLAISHLHHYLQTFYPFLTPIITHDLTKLQSVQADIQPSDLLLALMRLLRTHKAALERTDVRKARISEVGTPDLSPQEGGTSGQTLPPLSPGFVEQLSGRIEEKVTKIMDSKLATHIGTATTATMANPPLLPGQIPQYVPASQGQAPVVESKVQELKTPPWAPHISPHQSPHQQQSYSAQRYAHPRPSGRPPGPSGYTRNPNYAPLGNMGQRAPGTSHYQALRPPPPTGLSGATRTTDTNPWTAGRRLIAEDIYQKHFAGGKCFRCGLSNHSFRQCPHVCDEEELAKEPCPTCMQQGVMAFHKDCMGRITSLHHQPGPAHVQELGLFQGFYPEEGLPQDAPDGAAALPTYTPPDWPKSS